MHCVIARVFHPKQSPRISVGLLRPKRARNDDMILRKSCLLCFLILMAYTLFAQSDTTQKGKMNIGLGVSGFISRATDFAPSFNASFTPTYKKHSISLSVVISSKPWIPKGPGSLQPSIIDGIELDGFSFHYRFAPLYKKTFSPVMGYNFNYIKFAVNYSDESLTSYESLLTFGIQFNFLKKMSMIHEIGIGHIYYEHIYPNTVWDSQEQKRNELSGLMKISINYLL